MTAHRAIRRVVDHTIDHLPETVARINRTTPLVDNWHHFANPPTSRCAFYSGSVSRNPRTLRATPRSTRSHAGMDVVEAVIPGLQGRNQVVEPTKEVPCCLRIACSVSK